MTPARKPTEGMASWPVAWVRTDHPRGRCERALRVSVVPRVGAYAAPRSLARSLMCSSLCLRSSASQAWACSRRLIRYRRTRNCGALRQGRSPSLEATFLNELERSHPVRAAINCLKGALSRGIGGYRRGSSVVRMYTTGPICVWGWPKTWWGHSVTWATQCTRPPRRVGRFTGQL